MNYVMRVIEEAREAIARAEDELARRAQTAGKAKAEDKS
jgi:hypothetical protein